MRWVKTSQFTRENQEKCNREKTLERGNCESYLWVSYYEYGIPESSDAEDLTAKLESL